MTQKELQKLRNINQYPSVSIISPTHRTMPEKEQDPIRIKNLTTEAKDRLSKEFKHHEISDLLDNLDKAVRYIDYSQTLDAIILYVNKDGAQLYMLPIEVEENVTIDSRLELRPLERYLNRSFNYWVLALSEKPTRLFMGRHGSLVEVIDTQIGKDQEGDYPPLWQYDVTEPWSGFPYQHDYEVHSDREALAVGTGDKDSRYLDELKHKFFQEIDTILEYHLAKDNPAPIILLGTPENRSYFKEVSKHKNLIAGEIEGDFARSSIAEIEEAIEPIRKEQIKDSRDKAIKEFEQAIGSLHHAFGFEWVWRVAQEGRVDKLLVEKNYQVAGTVDEDNPKITQEYTHPDEKYITDDLVNSLIAIVRDKGGDVVFVEPDALKDHKRIAAILRY